MSDFFPRAEWMEVNLPTVKATKGHVKNLHKDFVDTYPTSPIKINISYIFYCPELDAILEFSRLSALNLVQLVDMTYVKDLKINFTVFPIEELYLLLEQFVYIDTITEIECDI